MIVVVQIPVLDTRRTLRPQDLAPYPVWPIPVSKKEYLKGHGLIVEKSYSFPVLKYAEHKYCDITRSIKQQFEFTYNCVPVKVLGKKFVDDGNGLCKYEFKFNVLDDSSIDIYDLVQYLIASCTFTIDNPQKSSFTLLDANGSLRKHYVTSTTKNGVPPNDCKDDVIFSNPTVFVSTLRDSFQLDIQEQDSYPKDCKLAENASLHFRTIELDSKEIEMLIFQQDNSKNETYANTFINVFSTINYKRKNLSLLFNRFIFSNVDFCSYSSIIRESLSYIVLNITDKRMNYYSYFEVVECLIYPNWRFELIKAITLKINDSRYLDQINSIAQYLNEDYIQEVKKFQSSYTLSSIKKFGTDTVKSFLTKIPDAILKFI